jgi:hypothetical protein
MKKKIIFLGQWWSVGESLFLVNLILNYCDYIKKYYKNDIHVIYHFINEKFMYENVIDIEYIKEMVDELHFENPELHSHILKENGYLEIFEWVYVHKDDISFFNSVFRYNESCWTKYEIFDMCFSVSHPTNVIRHEVEVLYRDYEFNNGELEYPKPLLKLNKIIKNITEKYRQENGLNEYEVIHFRWNNRYDNNCGVEVVDYLISRLEEVLDPEKKYFVSSNYSLFITKIQEKFKNILFIDRGDADFSIIESGSKTGKNLPTFIDERILSYNPTMTQLSNFMAHVEMDIINNSKRVIHCSEISRNMISLFLWIPLLINEVELLWISCGNNVIRKYNFNGCVYQNILDKPIVNKPECVKIIGGGRCND